jgi:hypothetical protein
MRHRDNYRRNSFFRMSKVSPPAGSIDSNNQSHSTPQPRIWRRLQFPHRAICPIHRLELRINRERRGVRYTAQGAAVCNFSVATTEKRRNARGETEERMTWFRVTAWGRWAEVANEYLAKIRTPFSCHRESRAASTFCRTQLVGGRIVTKPPPLSLERVCQ